MYCIKCGHPLEDKEDFCPLCGAKVNKVQVDNADSEPEVVSENSHSDVPKQLNKWMILISAGAVIIAAIILLIINFSGVKKWLIGTFTSAEELFVKAYKGNISAIMEPVLQKYDESLEAGSADELSSQSQICIRPGQQLLNTLSYAVYGETGEVEWLSEIRLDAVFVQKDSVQSNMLCLGLGDQDVISLELVTDTTEQTQYILVPEINSQALQMSVQDSGAFTLNTAELYKAMPSAQVIGQLADRYLDIFLNGFSNVEKKTQEMTLGAVTQELTVLEAVIDEADMIELTIRILEQARQDQELKTILENINPWYQEAMMQSAYDSLEQDAEQLSAYAEFLAETEALLSELQNQVETADPENQLFLYTYLDDRYRIVGIRMEATGMEDPVSFLLLSQESEYSAELLLGDMKLTGNGEITDSLSGDFEMFLGNRKMLNIRQEALTSEKGTVYLEPTGALITALAGEMGLGASDVDALGMTDTLIRVSYDMIEESSSASIALLSNETSVLELAVSGKTATQYSAPDIPDNAVSMEDEAAFYAWMNSLDLTELMENLQMAGVPQEILLSFLATAEE